MSNSRKVSDLAALLGTGAGGIAGSILAPNPVLGAVVGSVGGGLGGNLLGKWFAKNHAKPITHHRIVVGDPSNPAYISPEPIVERNIFDDLNSNDIQENYIYRPI
jgi:hypothetical protein